MLLVSESTVHTPSVNIYKAQCMPLAHTSHPRNEWNGQESIAIAMHRMVCMYQLLSAGDTTSVESIKGRIDAKSCARPVTAGHVTFETLSYLSPSNPSYLSSFVRSPATVSGYAQTHNSIVRQPSTVSLPVIFGESNTYYHLQVNACNFHTIPLAGAYGTRQSIMYKSIVL